MFVPYPTPCPSNVSDPTRTPPQVASGARAWTQSFVHDSLVYLGTTPGVHPYSWLHQELWGVLRLSWTTGPGRPGTKPVLRHD